LCITQNIIKMEFLPKYITDYVEAHTEPESPLLSTLSRETYVNILRARMLSGHLQGRVLSMLSHMIKPQHVLEIGTFTGYSALCLAEGMQKNGLLTTIDINEELEDFVRSYIDKSPFSSQFDYKIGNALTIIPTLQHTYDLVFIDADKINYAQYYDLIFDKVNTGGYIIIDNVLWYGKVVVKAGDKVDVDTKAIIDFNQQVHEDQRVQNVLFPIRDGLMVLRKK
jgi:caffeoyl-CoA O-methyltransferase